MGPAVPLKPQGDGETQESGVHAKKKKKKKSPGNSGSQQCGFGTTPA